MRDATASLAKSGREPAAWLLALLPLVGFIACVAPKYSKVDELGTSSAQGAGGTLSGSPTTTGSSGGASSTGAGNGSTTAASGGSTVGSGGSISGNGGGSGASSTSGECADGRQLCGGACVSTDDDNSHCGECGEACPSGSSCMAGVCECAEGQELCDDVCVDTMSDPDNC